jgi:hypothetical protein
VLAAGKDFAFVIFRTPEAAARAVAAGCQNAMLGPGEVTVAARVLRHKARERGSSGERSAEVTEIDAWHGVTELV